MIRAAVSLFLVLILSLIPNLAFGAGLTDPLDTLGTYQLGDTTITPSFTPLVTDLSVNYLGQIFGTVGTVLHGTSGQMLGQLFKVFNIGILVLAGIFLIYTIIMTVLNTAHEGEFMGRKWNSAWIAIRTVFGLGLLVPSMTTGYSTIQIIVMWVVIQGAGFANMAWYSALNYIAKGGQVYTPPATDSASMVDLVGTVMEMQVCMYTAERAYKANAQNLQQAQQQQQTQATPNTNTASPNAQPKFVRDFKPLFTVFYDSNKGAWNSVVKFPGNHYESEGKQDNACGQISFGTGDSEQNVKNDNKISTLQTAVRQIMLDTDSYAKQIANPFQQVQANSGDFANQVESAIVGAAADWVNITLPIRSGGPSISEALMKSYFKDAVTQGWIMAGRYYYALGSIQRQTTQATSVAVTVDNPPAGFPKPNGYIQFNQIPQQGDISAMNNLGISPSDKQFLANVEGAQGIGLYVNQARNIASQVDQAGQVNIDIGGNAGILAFLLNPLTSALLVLLQQVSTAVGDPILVLQGLGFLLMSAALGAWLAGTVGVFGLGAGGSILASVQPLAYAIQDAAITFVPTFTAFILIFFTLGATFAFYVPLIPFIIFVFSAVGWIIAVIEAMVAAPLVALGITHPEGHDLLGKSEQAIMLLLSVFLRPVLMIIGLVAGMILSRVVLRFLNTGFFGIIFELQDVSLFAFLAILVVYCMLLISIVNQTFALIYVIPDRVMRWLGVSEQSTAAQEALQATKAGFEQVAGGTEKLAGGVTSGSASNYEKLMRRKQKQAKADQKELKGRPQG